MQYNFIPENFKQFIKPIDKLMLYNPVSISIVGSYGNPNKKPNSSSDLDLIFVFKTNYIYKILKDFLKDLYKINELCIIELGVHFQFGYVISIFYKNNPLLWVDIGIMDINFAENYLINLPRKDVFGSINNSGVGQNPFNQMNHLARRIISTYNNKQHLTLKIACHRYLGWLKVYKDIQRIGKKQNDIDSDVAKLFKSYSIFNRNINIINMVMTDIQNRFPEISCMKERSQSNRNLPN